MRYVWIGVLVVGLQASGAVESWVKPFTELRAEVFALREKVRKLEAAVLKGNNCPEGAFPMVVDAVVGRVSCGCCKFVEGE